MKTTIDYISAIPGLGKTYWAIGELRKSVLRKECAIYVAPTTKLIDQVYEDLRGRLTEEELTFVSRYHHETCDHVPVKVAAAIKSKKLKPGTIILTTHETFLELRPLPEFAKFKLYFDEARKVVTQTKQVELIEPEAQELFRQLFDLEPRREGSSFRRVRLASSHGDQVLRKSKAFTQSPQLIEQYPEVKRLLDMAKNPRYEVYLSFPKEADTHEQDGSKYLMKAHKFFEIIVPSYIFEGFKKVTVLAAHFEDSQMYHLLKENKQVRLLNATNIELSEAFKNRFAALKHRYSMVTIVPLTPQWKALSTYQLRSQLLAPEVAISEILENIKSVGDLRTKVRELRINSGNKLTRKVQEKVNYLTQRGDVEFDPLRWYIQSARKVVANWKKVYPVHGLPLIMMNKIYTKKGSSYRNMLLTKTGRPLFEVLPFMNHGLNCYDDRNVLAFLAAVNPSPAMVRFYAERLPKYDFSKDYVADVANQSVCRLSLRDVDSKERVLVIVPDQNIASLLENKMFNRATRSMDWMRQSGSMVMVSNDSRNRLPPDHFKVESVKERRNEKVKKERNGCVLLKRITSINNMLTRYRKRLKEGAKVEGKIAQLEQERQRINELRKNPNMDKQKVLTKAKAS